AIASTAAASPINALAATDTDGTIVSYTISSLPTNGTLALAGTPVTVGQVLTPVQAAGLTYDPSGTFVGTDSFTFTATDNNGGVDASPATVSIPVYGVYPIALDDADLNNTIGSNGNVFILQNDTLSTGVGASISNATVDLNIATPGVENTLTVSGEGVFTYNTTTGEVVFVPEVGFMGNPTPLDYVLIENLSGLKDTASVVITYAGFPNAVDDEDLNNLPHIIGVVNALVNDTLSTGAIATFTTANVDLNPNTPSIDHILTVIGQGEYVYNPGSGIVTFTPEAGFEGNPTPIDYDLIENATGFRDQAQITMTYLLPIEAVDDSSMTNIAGNSVVVNVIANDTLSNGALATPGEVEVDLDPAAAGVQNSITIPGEGIWSYNPINGELTFAPEVGFINNPNPINYILTELVTGLTDTARVLVFYDQVPPVAINDQSLNNTSGTSVDINILTNDDLADGSPALISNASVDLNPATPTVDVSRTVAGEGTYTYNNTNGTLTFVPEVGFTSNPTPINYVLIQNNTGLKDTASITITYASPVEPVNDESVNNIPGINAIVNIIANDTLADGSPATPSEVTVDLNPSTPGVETSLNVPGEGSWTYNPANGQLEFNPENGFAGNPTPISYKLTENATGQSKNASVTVEYVPAIPPVAVNDNSLNNVPGVNAVMNIVVNDTLTDGNPATSPEVTVDLDLTQAGIQTTLSVANQGVWTYNGTNGEVTFNPNPGFTTDPTDISYVITEIATGLADTAVIHVTYAEVSPVANSNTSLNNQPQTNTVINLLANDLMSDQTAAQSNLVDVDLEPTVAGIQTSLLVVGEGMYNYNPTTGNITFQPAIGNYTNPTPIVYGLVEKSTGLSDTAMITIQYVFSPSLELVKVGTLMGDGVVGDSIRYDFTIINTGNVPVTGITISDAKISSTPIPVTPSALAPGGTAVASRMYYLTPADITAGEVINTANVSGTSSSGVTVVDTSDNGDPGMPGGSNPTRLSLSGTPDVDVKLTGAFVGNCERSIGDIVTYQVRVFREDTETELVDVIVKDSIGVNFELVSQLPSEGTYNPLTSRWSGVSLAAGDTATLTLQLRVLTNMGGLTCVESWVDSLSHNDLDSTPGDRVSTEDDIARACISVPISICPSRGESAQLTAATGYSTYQWYLNGALIVGANSASYTATTAGSYTVLVDGGTCPNGSCCPIVVQENCPCPVQICVPISITKTR
ncbi:MAG TPA: Ig-like domain-containing protein, partial [Leadbetterella sp.]|nr:Ig-like domain-containing protein [Leadbetterella sp.]